MSFIRKRPRLGVRMPETEMTGPRRFQATMALLMLGACARAPVPPPTFPPPPPCPIVASSGWQGWIDRDPNDQRHVHLTVAGMVTLPEDNWHPVWGDIERQGDNLVVKLAGISSGRPSGASRAQPVHGNWRVALPVANVLVLCRDTVLVRVVPVARDR